MSDQFLAEIRIFPFVFAPTGWAFCDGQLMPISQNTALFSLLGTTYGGDGKSTFGLPNMQGNAPMQPGQGPGLSLRDLGETSGMENITLLLSEMPSHSHVMNTTNDDGNNSKPGDGTIGRYFGRGQPLYVSPGALQPLAVQTVAPAGGGLPHSNMQPYLTLNYCIALQGIFPQRP
jgi:microcystin-dependent protein